MEIQDYSEKAIVVRGEKTKDCKDGLMQMGGKFNAVLKGGPGWIFPKTKKADVEKFIADGTIKKSDYKSEYKSEYKPKYQVMEKENMSSTSDKSSILQRLEKKIEILSSEIIELKSILSTLRSQEASSSSLQKEEIPDEPEIVFDDEEDTPKTTKKSFLGKRKE